ncbi:SGNH/GDSL hydrolase family protein [Candidatus Saccharibacteria bacterium]|nr:SGNH/GDSL hydrolase family protein [Candidatus Saccharibacteria bacterium]
MQPGSLKKREEEGFAPDNNDDSLNPANRQNPDNTSADGFWNPDGWSDESGDEPVSPNKSPGQNIGVEEMDINPLSGNNDAGRSDAESKLTPDKSFSNNLSLDNQGTNPAAKLVNGILRNRKKSIAGGVGLGGVVVTFYLLFASFAPFKVLHFANLLQRFHFQSNSEFMDGRTWSLYKVLKTHSVQNLRLGRIASRYAVKWDQAVLKNTGLKSVYSPITRRFIGYEVVDPAKADPLLKKLEAEGYNTNGSLARDSFDGSNNRVGQGSRIIDVSDEKLSKRRSLARVVTAGAEIEGVPDKLASRLLIKYGGMDFHILHPLQSVRRAATDRFVEWALKFKEDRAARVANGSTDVNLPKTGTDTNGDGNIDTTPDTTPESIAAGEANDIAEEVAQTAEKNRLKPSFISDKAAAKLKVAGRIAGSAAAAAALLCGVKALGNAAEILQYTNVILPMARVATSYMSLGAQIMSGEDVSSDEIGVYSQDLFDVLNNSDAIMAQPFQKSLNGVDSGPDLDSELKPGKLGEKPAFFRAIDDIPLLGTICSVQDFIGGLPVLKQIGEASQAGLNAILGPLGLSPDQLAGKLVDILAGSGINLYAVGAELGNYLMYGARIASNMASFAFGGSEMSESDEQALVADQMQTIALDNKSKSLYERYFDISNVDSLVARVSMSTPMNLKGFGGLVLQNPLNSLNFLTTKASAADYTFDYGFPKYGFTLTEQNSQIADDPLENANVVESDIQSFDDRFGSCFPKKIDPVTLNVVDNDRERYDVTSSDCNNKTDDQLRYRLYLADRVTELGLGCGEGDDSSCSEIGLQTSEFTAPEDAPVNNQIYFLGDSLTKGMQTLAGSDPEKNYLARTFDGHGWQSTVNAQGCRAVFQTQGPITGDGSTCPSETIVDGITALSNDTQIIQSNQTGTFVVGLGTNRLEVDASGNVDQNLFREKFAELIKQIKQISPNSFVYVVNLVSSDNNSNLEDRNAIIEDVISQFQDSQNIILLDWNGYVKNAKTTPDTGDDVEFADSVHHTIDGYIKKVQYLLDNIALPSGSSTAGGRIVNCDGYTEVLSPDNFNIRSYSQDIKDNCLKIKQKCLSGVTDTERILCTAMEFDGTFYGNGYGTYSGVAANQIYGFTASSSNYGGAPQSWLQSRSEGLSPNNLLECSGLASVALFKAYNYQGVGCSGNWTSQQRPDLFEHVNQNEIIPGDFLTISFGCNSDESNPAGGHVAIAASSPDASGNIIVYETNTWGKPVRFTSSNLSDYPGGWSRYIGPGVP